MSFSEERKASFSLGCALADYMFTGSACNDSND